MVSVPDALQSWIDTPGHDQTDLGEALDHVDALDHTALAQVRLARRFAKGFASFEAEGASALDLAVLLRQIIRSYNRRFWIPAELWQTIAQLDRRAGLQAIGIDRDRVEVTALPWQTDWLVGTEHIDDLETRRVDQSAPGSSALFQAYGHIAYQSEAQKVAVEACQFAPPRSTTLITLPTGGGKSLCMVLPAWIRSHGGTIAGGATIVILPTVALALDQFASARRYFCSARGLEYQPRCWSSSTGENERRAIQEALENGTVPLLFTSPSL